MQEEAQPRFYCCIEIYIIEVWHLSLKHNIFDWSNVIQLSETGTSLPESRNNN